MQPSSPRLGALLAGALAVACQRSDAPADDTAAAPPTPRIVSLSPALSRTLLDFGLGDRVVGRTPFCSFLDQAIPVVGSLYDVDYERLIRLDPTHILVQRPRSGLDPQLDQLARERGWTIGQWSINTIEDIEASIRELPGTLYGDRPQPRAEATRRAAELLNEIASALSPGGGELWRGRTLLVSNTDPVLVFGRGTYLDDILSALGGSNAVTRAGWAELSLEDVVRLDPEAMILVREAGTRVPREAAGALAALDITAVAERRIAVLIHPDANLPSSGVIGVARELRRVLGELAERAP